MTRAQPDPAQDLVGWMRWEQELAAVLAASGEWERLLLRLESLPAGLPAGFRRWAAAERAAANIALGRGAEARRILRELLWAPGAAEDPRAFERWRELVVRSYLAEARRGDARDALRRYRQDYGVTDDLRALQARVLIEAGRFREAAVVLAEGGARQSGPLRRYAELRAGVTPPDQTWRLATEAARDASREEAERARWWRVAAEAAGQAGRHPQAIQALEQALAEGPLRTEGDRLLTVDPVLLWDAYRRHAEAVGNRAQLLVGDDPSWLALAEGAEPRDPVAARALYAVLVTGSRSEQIRAQAAERLAASLDGLGERGGRVLYRLYLGPERFAEVDRIPLPVRYRLVDQALGRGDIDLATRLMRGLERPPEGSDPVAWGLRRARVLVLGGRYVEGSDALAALLRDLETGDKATIDRILQVVFDLQRVGRDEEAIAHLRELRQRASDPQQQREILFWTADSYKSLDDPLRAAHLYLRSATLHDPAGLDPWGQTARYHAAESLAEAGLVADARRLYEQLLAATREPARQAVLRHAVQQLWLQQ